MDSTLFQNSSISIYLIIRSTSGAIIASSPIRFNYKIPQSPGPTSYNVNRPFTGNEAISKFPSANVVSFPRQTRDFK
jgi:hypothetical protein